MKRLLFFITILLLGGRMGLAEPVGFLLKGKGDLKVTRAGKAIPISTVLALESGDEVRVAEGGIAYVTTPRGSMEIKGPRTLVAGGEGFLTAGTPVATGSEATGEAIVGRGRGSGSARFETALLQPPAQVLASISLNLQRAADAIRIYSPCGLTANLRPVVLWKVEPGARYVVTIRNELEPSVKPLQFKNVNSPLFLKSSGPDSARFAKEGLYRLTVQEVGKPLNQSETVFQVSKDATELEEDVPGSLRLVRAAEALRSESPRIGDAMADLLLLPKELADSELAVRLRLLATAQLGVKDDYEAAAAALSQGKHP